MDFSFDDGLFDDGSTMSFGLTMAVSTMAVSTMAVSTMARWLNFDGSTSTVAYSTTQKKLKSVKIFPLKIKTTSKFPFIPPRKRNRQILFFLCCKEGITAIGKICDLSSKLNIILCSFIFKVIQQSTNRNNKRLIRFFRDCFLP